MEKCRSCYIEGNKKSFCHQTIFKYCALCKDYTESSIHPADEGFHGISYECTNCHNYIEYWDDKNLQKWKDEIYLPDDHFLIRNYEIKISSYFVSQHKGDWHDDEEICSFDSIIEIDDPQTLKKKLDNLIVFL